MQTFLRERRVQGENPVFFLNSGLQIDVSGVEQNKNVLISGTSGGGKTVLMAGIADQVGKGLLIDSKGKGRETIEKIGFKGWSFFDQADRLLVNASELQLSSVNVLFSEDDVREQRLYNVFTLFCALPVKQKRFSVLRKMLESVGQYNLANDLELVFHRQDKGMDLSEILQKKSCWNVRGISQFNKGVGLLIKMLYDYTYLHPLKRAFFLACDDAQTAATIRTSLGRAFAASYSEGRVFRIVNLMSGTHDSYLDYGIKINADVVFYFPSRKEQKKLKGKGVDFKDARVINLRKAHPDGGVCFVETELPVFLSGQKGHLSSPFPFYFDVFGYLKQKKKVFRRGDRLPIQQDFYG